MIIVFLGGFLILILLYHILTTVIGFGIFNGNFPQIPSLLRDGIWIFGFIISTLAFWKLLPGYRKRRKHAWLRFVLLCLFSIFISWIKDKSFYDMFVGFKYGFQYISFFLMATVLGWIAGKQHIAERIERFFRQIPIGLTIVVAFGFLWQGAKLLWPNLFLHLGYGPLDDFHFGANPPLYYLTGLGGTLRWQGIFAGPNNYGYFLIAFLPLILHAFPLKLHERKSWFTKTHILTLCINILWMYAILATLSRTAIIGVLVIFALTQIDRWKSHKKWAYGFGALALVGLVGLSILKGSSTLAHLHAKLGSLSYVFQHPLGYGLGSSGPAIHHNGTILPENYFIQLLIDIGRIGFALWLSTIFFCAKAYIKTTTTLIRNQIIEAGFLKAYAIGCITLFVMGIFLHVFEDSMVNYSFFILWGFFLGYLQSKYITLSKRV
ncbi:MAG: hypothetical protein WCO66_04685 [Candidatus Absconditabacteria bacterium]